MKSYIKTLSFIAALAVSGAAMAQAASPVAATSAGPAIKGNEVLRSSDGRRIGTVDRVVLGQDRSPVAVSLVVGSRFVKVPVSTITAANGGLVTSLSYDEIKKLP